MFWWFKFDVEFLNAPAFQRIAEQCPKRGGAQSKHILDALKIISCAQRNPMKTPMGMSEISWNALIDEGVLRMDNGGYTSRAWLSENGLCGGDKKIRRKRIEESPKPTETQPPKEDKPLEISPDQIAKNRERLASVLV